MGVDCSRPCSETVTELYLPRGYDSLPWRHNARDWSVRDFDRLGEILSEYGNWERGRRGRGVMSPHPTSMPMPGMPGTAYDFPPMPGMPTYMSAYTPMPMSMPTQIPPWMSPNFQDPFPSTSDEYRNSSSRRHRQRPSMSDFERMQQDINDRFQSLAEEYQKNVQERDAFLFGSESERRQELYKQRMLKMFLEMVPQIGQLVGMAQGGGSGAGVGVGGLGAGRLGGVGGMGAGLGGAAAGMGGLGMNPMMGQAGMTGMNGMPGAAAGMSGYGGGMAGMNPMAGGGAATPFNSPMMGGMAGMDGMGGGGLMGGGLSPRGGGRRNNAWSGGGRRGRRGRSSSIAEFDDDDDDLFGGDGGGGGFGRRRGSRRRGRYDDEDDDILGFGNATRRPRGPGPRPSRGDGGGPSPGGPGLGGAFFGDPMTSPPMREHRDIPSIFTGGSRPDITPLQSIPTRRPLSPTAGRRSTPPLMSDLPRSALRSAGRPTVLDPTGDLEDDLLRRPGDPSLGATYGPGPGLDVPMPIPMRPSMAGSPRPPPRHSGILSPLGRQVHAGSPAPRIFDKPNVHFAAEARLTNSRAFDKRPAVDPEDGPGGMPETRDVPRGS